MDFFNIGYLLGLGFVIGLSGAMMPGPLLFYTIQEALHRSRWVGLPIILGHMFVELFFYILLAWNLKDLMQDQNLVKAAGILGGSLMVVIGLSSLGRLQVKEGGDLKLRQRSFSLFLGGIVFTAFNPGFPIWWATAGARMLFEGFMVLGSAGMFLIMAGHWIADLGWYLLVSSTSYESSKTFLSRGWYVKTKTILSLMLAAIGLYFIYRSL